MKRIQKFTEVKKMTKLIEKNTTGNMKIYDDSVLIVLYSYSSRIAEVDSDGKIRLFQDFDYSATTRKHLAYFLKKYAGVHLTRKQKMAIRKETIEKLGY